MQLVLSLFPGIGLLDMAFEQEGFCVVRGPDLLWGGDIRRFHPPAGRFDGVIGGPPCQAFSAMRAFEPRCGKSQGNLIPEFERCVVEAWPQWFLMENVTGAPVPSIDGFWISDQIISDVATGGETSRRRRFTFGNTVGERRVLRVEELALWRPDPEASVLASEVGKGMPSGTRSRYGNPNGYLARPWSELCRLMGLPEDWDLPAFKKAEKCRVLGNGVPLPMGRAVAKAVKEVLKLG